MIHIYSLAQLLNFNSLAIAHFIRIVLFSFLFFLGLYNKLSVLACLQLVNLTNSIPGPATLVGDA